MVQCYKQWSSAHGRWDKCLPTSAFSPSSPASAVCALKNFEICVKTKLWLSAGEESGMDTGKRSASYIFVKKKVKPFYVQFKWSPFYLIWYIINSSQQLVQMLVDLTICISQCEKGTVITAADINKLNFLVFYRLLIKVISVNKQCLVAIKTIDVWINLTLRHPKWPFSK